MGIILQEKCKTLLIFDVSENFRKGNGIKKAPKVSELFCSKAGFIDERHDHSIIFMHSII